MDILIEKFKETSYSVIPVVLIVLFLIFFIVDVDAAMTWRFLLGAVLIIFGLTIFLFGIEIGMTPIGNHLGKLVIDSNSYWFTGIVSFIMGFGITIAEPDLLILGQQMENATDGILPSTLTVFSVSVGVGLLISLGVIRLLKGIPLRYFFLVMYTIVFFLAYFSDETTIAMGFDASGATTGALTTPFVLALSTSIAARKGGKTVEDDSFGLVGSMSVGPILAVFLLVLLTQADLQPTETLYQYDTQIWQPVLSSILPVFFESLLALLPILLLFLVFLSTKKISIDTNELSDILKGVFYTIIGLTLFLIGVQEGFMDMGHYLGYTIAGINIWSLVLTGTVLGLVVVLAEPAVHVLGDEVEEVSGGYIKNSLLLISLSIGVGIAVGLSMLRVALPSLQASYIIFPGFAIALFMSFFVSNMFTGIAFDAGGVASGPMTATFILSFSQGAADSLPQADALDAFGIIAFVAMTPVITVQLLGIIYRINTHRKQAR